MEIILVRHGATAWTAERRYQGQTDIPLSDIGEAEAAALRPVLEPLVRPDTRIFSSDLSRARRTAELSLPSSSVTLDARLREIHFGAFEGLTFDENRARFPELFPDGQVHPQYVTGPEGESLDALQTRLFGWLHELDAEHVIAFTHGGVIRAFLGAWLDCGWASEQIGRISTGHARAVRLDASRKRILDGPFCLEAA